MATRAQLRLTPDEYLDAERRADVKSEYLAGEVMAMSGASYAHNLIVANCIGELHGQLKGSPCAVLPSDVRVWIEADERFVYPDVTVVCGDPRFVDGHQDTIINPTLLIEVLSRSTSNYDRGEKFVSYRRLDAFSEYVLLAQDRPHCEHFVRQTDGSWRLTEVDDLGTTLELSTIACTLDLASAYDRVPFGPRAVG